MQKGVFILQSFIICCNFVYSQNFSLTQIDSLVLAIDSSIYKQITIDGTVITKPGRDKGSSAQTFYFDSASKRLVKVEVAQAFYDKKKHLTSVELTTYYYCDKLIMVKASRFDTFGYPNFRKTLSSGRYYYMNDALILSNETGYKHGGITYIRTSETYRDVLFKKVLTADY